MEMKSLMILIPLSNFDRLEILAKELELDPIAVVEIAVDALIRDVDSGRITLKIGDE